MKCFSKLLLGLGALIVPGSPLLIWGSGPKTLSVKTVHVFKESHLPRIYEEALRELEELESEPFCHRIAARLLVTNCHLLDGKDEASVLTDSGRRIRDFIDAYAASLAICDLERGNFIIPKECSPFQEPALTRLPTQTRPQLHVGPKQIEDCLTGLARSDSAWSTWVSYRHKAVRFCEAARADNEKSQNILLYQRLTKVIAKLADNVEAEIQKRMESLDLHARHASEAMGQLTPQVDRLRHDLDGIQSFLTRDLNKALQGSISSVHEGLDQASNLQQLLVVLMKTVMDGNSQIAFAHEQSLDSVSSQMNNKMAVFMTAMAATVESSASLQSELELSRLQATELAHQQGLLEEGMGQLFGITKTLSTHQQAQAHMLLQAGNITNDILATLETAASSAVGIKGSLLRENGASSWWSFIVYPTACLVMGSYRLPPSAFRNLGLVALGGFLGLLISFYDQLNWEFVYFPWESPPLNLETANLTAMTP